MRHSSTRELYAYWTRQRGARSAPLRNAIEPAHIRTLLGDTFILDASKAGRLTFRLAGTRLCASLGHEMKDEDFLALWQGADGKAIAALQQDVTRDATVAVVAVQAASERGHAVEVEIILLPVSQNGRGIDRILGLIVPMERPYWLGLHPLTRLSLDGIRRIGANEHPTPARTPLATPNAAPPAPSEPASRRHQHLVLLDGGKN